MLTERVFTMYFLSAFLMSVSASAALISSDIEYTHENQTFQGYLVYDDAYSGKRPGIMVVHEWKGLGPYAKKRADQLAELGYVALAADIYGKGVRAESHEEAAQFSKPFLSDRDKLREHASVSLAALKEHELVDSKKIAAIGYCFGGTTVLEMARAGMPILGVASFHGGLSTTSRAGEGDVKAKVLVFHGAEDDFVSQEDIENFKAEMTAAGADWQMVIFSDAVHSFTVSDAGSDPADGIAYNEQADLRSWKILKLFFDELFEPRIPQMDTQRAEKSSGL